MDNEPYDRNMLYMPPVSSEVLASGRTLTDWDEPAPGQCDHVTDFADTHNARCVLDAGHSTTRHRDMHGTKHSKATPQAFREALGYLNEPYDATKETQ
jgi:hypothetical protein